MKPLIGKNKSFLLSKTLQPISVETASREPVTQRPFVQQETSARLLLHVVQGHDDQVVREVQAGLPSLRIQLGRVPATGQRCTLIVKSL